MIMYPETIQQLPAGSLYCMKPPSCHHITLDTGIKPNQAATIVADVRHKVHLPLVVEIENSATRNDLARLARAAAAAGANVISVTVDDFATAKAILSELYTALTLPLVIRCPLSNSEQRRQLETMGATKVIPLKAPYRKVPAVN